MVGKILKAKYFPNESALMAKLGPKPSYAWRSLFIEEFIISRIIMEGRRWEFNSGLG
jgi:hypothetical protein